MWLIGAQLLCLVNSSAEAHKIHPGGRCGEGAVI